MMVRYEDGKWINNIGVYYFILKELNEDLLQLINYESSFDEKIELLFFKLAVNLNRIFPMQHKNVSKNDGILRLKKSIDFLEPDYKKIFKNYKNHLIMINDVRNKFEHAPHIIKWKQYIGNNKEKKLWFISNNWSGDWSFCRVYIGFCRYNCNS